MDIFLIDFLVKVFDVCCVSNQKLFNGEEGYDIG